MIRSNVASGPKNLFYVFDSANHVVAGMGGGGSNGGNIFVSNAAGTTTISLQNAGPSFFNGGNVGIGTTGPGAKLHIEDSTFPTLFMKSSAVLGTWLQMPNTSTGGHAWTLISTGSGNGEGSGRFIISDQTAGLTRMLIDPSGNVGINTITPAYKLDVNGQIRVQSTVYSSDARYKRNIATFDNALETILNLRGITFNWRRDQFQDMNFAQDRQIAFIAQEVEKVLPELVSTDASGYKSVAYANVVPVIVEALKTLKKENDTTRKQKDNEIAQLKAKNEELEARLNALTEVVEKLQNDRK